MRHLKITPSGVIFLGITAFVFIAAFNSGTNLLFLALGLMVGGFVVSALLSRVSLSHLHVRRVMIDHAVAGEPADLHYEITNLRPRWPAFALGLTESPTGANDNLAEIPHAYALHIPPGKSITVPARLLARHRGVVPLKAIRIACAFPFGFVSHSIDIPAPEKLVVYPRIGTLSRQLALRCRDATESGTMTSSVRRGNDEFYGLREYRAGDNVRSIHWRSTARTGRLTIREMANNAPPQMIVVLNLREARSLTNAQPTIERAIELAAALLCYAFLENFAVGLAIAGETTDMPPIPHMGREARSTLLHRLATLNPHKLDPHAPIPMPNRVTSRAQWVIVTLSQTDRLDDLSPPAATTTRLAMDDPDADDRVHFVTGHETLRILREAVSPTPAIVPTSIQS